MTTCINLIPADIVVTRQAHAKRRGWLAACILLAAAGVVASLAVRASLRDPRGLAGELDRERDRLARAGADVDSAKAALRAAQIRLNAVGGLADRPNWQVLLGIIAQSRLDTTVIDAISLKRAPAPPAPAAAASGAAPATPGVEEQSFLVMIKGRGERQRDITELALRLEQTELFASVRQERVQAVQVGERTLLEFEFTCALGPSAPKQKDGK